MDDADPAHLADVQEAVDAAEVDEGAVVLDGFDAAGEVLAGAQILHCLFLRHFSLFSEKSAAGEDEATAGRFDLGDLRAELLADVGIKIGDVAHLDLAGWHESAEGTDFDFEAALVGLLDEAVDDLADGDGIPVAGDFRATAGEIAEGEAVFFVDAIDDDVVLVANLGRLVLRELAKRDDAGRAETEVEEDVVAVNGLDGAVQFTSLSQLGGWGLFGFFAFGGCGVGGGDRDRLSFETTTGDGGFDRGFGVGVERNVARDFDGLGGRTWRKRLHGHFGFSGVSQSLLGGDRGSGFRRGLRLGRVDGGPGLELTGIDGGVESHPGALGFIGGR